MVQTKEENIRVESTRLPTTLFFYRTVVISHETGLISRETGLIFSTVCFILRRRNDEIAYRSFHPKH
jgi:hypothetical protein